MLVLSFLILSEVILNMPHTHITQQNIVTPSIPTSTHNERTEISENQDLADSTKNAHKVALPQEESRKSYKQVGCKSDGIMVK